MSRAERALPPRPRLRGSLRVAAIDLYYHGVRLVVANVVWGIGLLVTAYALTQSPVGLLLLVAMTPLTIGLMGMASVLVRERSLVLADFPRSIRSRFWSRFAVGCAQLLALGIAVVDLVVGIELGGVIGLALGVAAFYTVVAVWILAVVTWPLLTDPVRGDQPTGGLLRLALLLVLAHPVRMAAIALVVAAILAVSTVLAAAIVMFAGVYAFLVAAHFVLPAADRLEGRLTAILED